MMILLFLDDKRNLEDVTWVKYPEFSKINTVRTVFEFYNALDDLLTCYELKDIAISFDHDLGEFGVHGEDRNGKVCANYLIDNIILSKLNPNDLTYYVHSKNPIGADNIHGLIQGYIRFYNSELNDVK